MESELVHSQQGQGRQLSSIDRQTFSLVPQEQQEEQGEQEQQEGLPLQPPPHHRLYAIVHRMDSQASLLLLHHLHRQYS